MTRSRHFPRRTFARLFSTRRTRIALTLAMVLAVPHARAQTDGRREEQPLQDEKMFQHLLSDYQLLARLLIHENRYSEAVLLLQTIYEQSFHSPVVARELCDTLEKAGRREETIPILKEQAQADPLNTSWNQRLIAATAATSRWEDLLRMRLDQYKKSPSDLENLAGLIEAYRQLQKNDDAEKLVEKMAIATRDKLVPFQQPPGSRVHPDQSRLDAEGLMALRLQKQFALDDDFEQFAASYLLRQQSKRNFDAVLDLLSEAPPAGYLKSVFPEQQAVGLWLAGRPKEAAGLLEKKFPAGLYAGADHLLYRYYVKTGADDALRRRFPGELPAYLRDEPAPRARPEAVAPESPIEDGEVAAP